MDENHLVAALKNQEPAAFQELIAVHGDRLLRSAFLLCGDPSEAQDFVQETFVQALSSIHRFRGQSTLHTWLHSILLNLTRRHHRDRRRIIYDGELADKNREPRTEPTSDPDADTDSAALAAALDQLSPPHREVLVLRFYEHKKIHEIAAALGVSKGTVKSRLHYAIQRMQQLLPAEMNLFRAHGTNHTE
jgi:RNA polymerase sigma-70 factor (ECF subfamily)